MGEFHTLLLPVLTEARALLELATCFWRVAAFLSPTVLTTHAHLKEQEIELHGRTTCSWAVDSF